MSRSKKQRPQLRVFAFVIGVAALLALPVAQTFAETVREGPKPVKRELPVYPKGAEKRGIEGYVMLEFNIDGNGNVVAPRVTEASPPGVFDAAAIEALSKWKYEALGAETTNVQVKLTFKDP